jgi:hypothetical protein
VELTEACAFELQVIAPQADTHLSPTDEATQPYVSRRTRGFPRSCPCVTATWASTHTRTRACTRCTMSTRIIDQPHDAVQRGVPRARGQLALSSCVARNVRGDEMIGWCFPPSFLPLLCRVRSLSDSRRLHRPASTPSLGGRIPLCLHRSYLLHAWFRSVLSLRS